MIKVGEAELLDACRDGHVLECLQAGKRRQVEAALLRRCCLELKDQVDPRGIRLHNAVVTGCLDLADINVSFPLRFDSCEFDSAPIVEGALLHDLALIKCQRLPGLLANGLQVRRDLDLSHSTVTGAHHTKASSSKRSAIWLCESDIGGRLLCVDTVIHSDGERSVQADLMHVGGTVRLAGQFTAVGEVRLLGARIDGSLDMQGSHIESLTGLALDVAESSIGGSMFLIDETSGRRPLIHGRIDMASARITGQFLIRNATLRGQGAVPDGVGYSRSWVGSSASLSAPRLSVGGEMTVEGSTDVTGGLDLSMSDLTGLEIGDRCTLRAPGHTALDLANAELRSSLTLHECCTVNGMLRLTNARIHGSLTLQKVGLSAPAGRSLIDAEGIAVDGDVELQNLCATGGELNFRAAAMGSGFNAAGASLSNPEGFTLILQGATVRASVHLADDFKSVGVMGLNRSTIDGNLNCVNGSFNCPAASARNSGGHAIEMISAMIRGGVDLGWKLISPSVDFTNTKTTFLADNPTRWPPRFVISGFTYDSFERSQGFSSPRIWDPSARCAWLNRLTAYDASPYEQAARVFRQHGYAREAEQILMAQGKHARTAITGKGAIPRRALNTAFRITVGYGYRPARVLWMLATLLILVIVSLEIPATQAVMRATATDGTIYTTHGPIYPSSHINNGRANQSIITSKNAIDTCGNGKVHCFNPAFYAIDTVIPLISLDQRSTWYPDPYSATGTFMQWWLNSATLLGWLLSSIFVLSLARLARSP